jgi:hypothetical protein
LQPSSSVNEKCLCYPGLSPFLFAAPSITSGARGAG